MNSNSRTDSQYWHLLADRDSHAFFFLLEVLDKYLLFASTGLVLFSAVGAALKEVQLY